MQTREQDTARPRFYREAVQNHAASEKEGRPIFDDREMVEIIVPGDRLSTFVGYVDDRHRERWPDAYAAFKRGEQRAAAGTPLEHWPILTTARVAELKAMNILSVEELANVTDNVVVKLGMGARELREQARTFIDAARGGAASAAAAAENERLKEQMAMLQQQVAQLMAGAVQPPQSKALEDCSDAELKEFIKRETGEPVRGNPSRDTLLSRAAELAKEAA